MFNIFRPKKQLVGRVETVSFPDLQITKAHAKVDTGAYRSVLHAYNIHEVDTPSGRVLYFTVYKDNEMPGELTCSITNFSKTKVKSSNGIWQDRYKIITDVVIVGRRITSEFTLADRQHMKYPVLIGRQVLYNNLLVDITIKNL